MCGLSEKPDLVKELHGDLARKYQLHGEKIEQIWRSLDRRQRRKVVKAGTAEGLVLKHSTDQSLGNVCHIIPEWNLRDITKPASVYLLDHLKHRASKSLCDQYCKGVNDGPGDAGFIFESTSVNHFHAADAIPYTITVFIEGQYGHSYTAKNSTYFAKIMAEMSKFVKARVCVSHSMGELILERQIYFLQLLNILVGDILDMGSRLRQAKERSSKRDEGLRTALVALSINKNPEKLSLMELIDRAIDQKSSLEECVDLCCTEPVFLDHLVNTWYYSRPELVRDEKGRTMPVITDKYISISFFEAIHNAVVGAATWAYICSLLKALVDGSKDRAYSGILLQEMVNVCRFEYLRVQRLFKRHLQIGSCSKYFRRVFGVYDNGTPRVTMKIKPDVLTREEPQAHYMLRLCQADVNEAITWIKKLDDLHRSQPMERDKMLGGEFDAFGDLAATTSFIQSLSKSLRLPPINHKKGQTFISKSKALGIKMDSLKTEVDLADFAIPIDNLLEPGMAAGAVIALNRFILDKVGSHIGFLYYDLIEDCLSDIQESYQQQKEKAAQDVKAVFAPPIVETPSPRERFEQRKQKIKTRPENPSIYCISPIRTTEELETRNDSPIFKVRPATFEVFSTLFSRSKYRGSINWAAFETAMTDLRFSVVPRFGSVFTFFPPKDSNIQRPLTIHRPHQSRVEGYNILVLARRIQRVYGWGEKSFEVACMRKKAKLL